MSDTNEVAARLRDDISEFEREGEWRLCQDLRALLDERESLLREVEFQKQRCTNNYNAYQLKLDAAEKERDALRARLEAAEKVMAAAEKTLVADEDDTRHYSKMHADWMAARKAMGEYRARFGGRDEQD